jgi:hypothetical protein
VATHRSNGKTMYGFDVVYRYHVAGREFNGSNVFFGGDASSGSSATAHRVTRRHPEGSQVKVFYQPDSPANAVLDPGAGWQSYVVFGIGLLFLIVGVFVFGGSLIYVLAAGAILGGAAAAWLGGSASRRTARDRFTPGVPPPDVARAAPPRSNAAGAQDDDGFDLQ